MSTKNDTKPSGARPLVKVKSQKVSLVMQSQVSLDRPKTLADSFAVTVTTGNHSTTYTVHRPIGITDLDDDDWVVTPVGDIPSLLSRADDPAQQEINKKRALIKNARLVEAGLLVQKGDALFYPSNVHDGEEDRNALLNMAEAKFQEHKKTVREEFKKSHPNAKQNEIDSLKFVKRRVDFLPDKLKVHEKSIADFLDDQPLREAIEEAVPQTYRTRGGPLLDRDQVACPVIGKTKTVTAAEDKLNSWLYSQLVTPVAKTIGTTTDAASVATDTSAVKKKKKKGLSSLLSGSRGDSKSEPGASTSPAKSG